MKKEVISAISLASALMLSTAVQAQQTQGWEGSVSLGYVGTTGNTETDSYNAEVHGALGTARWTHDIKLQALGASDEDGTTAERYFLEEKSDYHLDDDMHYLFGGGNVTKDRFSGYNYQASLVAGYGRYLVRNETYVLEAFGGPGYRISDTDLDGREGEVILNLGERFEWHLSETSFIYQGLRSEIGSDLRVSVFEAGVESSLIGNIATKIAFQARHNSVVPPGNEKTDTQTSISLVYRF